MFGIGTPELLVILAVALIVIGPKKLPDLAKSLGRALGEFKRATNDLKQSLEQESSFNDVREHIRGAKQDVLTSVSPDRKQVPGTTDAAPPPPGEPVPPFTTDSDADTGALQVPDEPAGPGQDPRPKATPPPADDEGKTKE